MPAVVGLLSSARAMDGALILALTDLVNTAYAVAEAGLWLEGVKRTNSDEMCRWVHAEQVVAAFDGGRLVGAVRTFVDDQGSGWFGALSVAPLAGGRGIGRRLVTQVEFDAAAAGSVRMAIEVLASSEGHDHLDRLRAWYERLGYREVGRRQLLDVSPEEAPFMAVPMDVVDMRKAF